MPQYDFNHADEPLKAFLRWSWYEYFVRHNSDQFTQNFTRLFYWENRLIALYEWHKSGGYETNPPVMHGYKTHQLVNNTHSSMGLLPATLNYGLRMRRE